MIKFDDVKIEKELTYTFAPAVYATDVEWCFEKNGITDYEVYGKKDFDKVVPQNVTIPVVRYSADSDDPIIGGRTCVFITHMNSEQLLQKIYEIGDGADPDIMEKHHQDNLAAWDEYEKNYKDLEGQIPIRA
jgi:hypothetical protein